MLGYERPLSHFQFSNSPIGGIIFRPLRRVTEHQRSSAVLSSVNFISSPGKGMPKRLVPSRIGQWLYQLEALRTPVGHFICWRVYEWLPKVPINKENAGSRVCAHSATAQNRGQPQIKGAYPATTHPGGHARLRNVKSVKCGEII